MNPVPLAPSFLFSDCGHRGNAEDESVLDVCQKSLNFSLAEDSNVIALKCLIRLSVCHFLIRPGLVGVE
ncbi:hypothetical protein FNV43_RR09836 [Rhamnella rubrinervis]|uniref:Uncharacterized protein n=1 Tax=Rhamnella rubrinervis TaxID=2594499 RepID=A0A8K0HAS7_9ROSA|nr:hypothetical protein FNV43_RR09836 [Rhamnella rubrinervis]